MTILLQAADFRERKNFGSFLQRRGLVHLALEVGTHRGQFAADFLQTWPGRLLYCVDHWLPHYDPDDGAAWGDREADYQEALRVLSRYGNRAQVLRKTSREAAATFQDGTLDFVYVDACHRYEAVLDDLETWWPKIRSGGILAGHDFICPREAKSGWGQFIQPAVLEFCRRQQVPMVYLVPDYGADPWSFYLEKL